MEYPKKFKTIDGYVDGLFSTRFNQSRSTQDMNLQLGLPLIHVTPNEGLLLYTLARIKNAKHILEIGSLGGYSTTWLSQALPLDGTLYSIEIDEGYSNITRQNLEKYEQVKVFTGDAKELMRTHKLINNTTYDLVFVDANKNEYLDYHELILPLSRPGTVIIYDNLIRDGRVIAPEKHKDEIGKLSQFNLFLSKDERVHAMILPMINREIIDGIGIVIVNDNTLGIRR
jgi:predicted O-methyltransferase YrrM